MKRTNFFPFVVAFVLSTSLFSQSNIQQTLSVNSSGAAADASAQLDVSATDKGMLVPRMTTAQRTAIATPATGLLVFDTTTGGFWFYNGTGWVDLSAPKTLADSDNDTKIQVEESADEDIIRFDLGGTESMVLRKNAGGSPRLELPNASSNIFIGTNVGQANTTGYNITANGVNALQANTTGISNTANGFNALQSNTTGFYNTANGVNALQANTFGSGHTAIGFWALYSNTSGSNNTANGSEALRENTTGSQNTANGAGALFFNTTGFQNTATGLSALYGNTTGNNNTATGRGALLSNSTGAGNTAIGLSALTSNTTGSNNTALGRGADVSVNNLSNATAVGYNARVGASNSLVLGGTGADTVRVGVGTTIPAASALLDLTSTSKGMLVPRMTTAQRTAIASSATGLLVYDTDTNTFWFYNGTAWAKVSQSTVLADTDNDTKIQVEKNPDEDIIRFDLAGTESMVLRKNAGGMTRLELPSLLDNTFVGANAGLANTTGNYNTAHGNGALTGNTVGTQNTANGYYALFSNSTGNQNAAFGNAALTLNSTGSGNAAVGMQALTGNTIGDFNTATGSYSLFSNTTGHSNTGIGSQALFVNSTGKGNTAAGYSALFSNTTGYSNVALGRDALYNNTDRSNLVAVGDSALYNNGTGASMASHAKFNTAVGSKALFANTTGSNNTANGALALNANTTGTNNTANGVNALNINTTGSFNTALGNSANVSTGALTNATALGNGTTVNASDKVRIGNASVTVIEGQVDFTFPSDARFKFNVHDETVPGLAFINQLRPVTYQFDTRKFDQHLMQNMPDSIQQKRLAQQDYSESTAIVQTGFLAQEVEQACKELNFQFSGLHVPTSDVDNYGLAYGSFVPLLVKGMQEQQTIIEAQKEEIDSLKSQLDKITAALAGAGIAVEK